MQVAGQHHESIPLHSVNIDFCFKLAHLRRSCGAQPGEVPAFDAPPNQRYFLDDKLGLDAIQEAAGKAPNDEKACADFRADAVSSPLSFHRRPLHAKACISIKALSNSAVHHV